MSEPDQPTPQHSQRPTIIPDQLPVLNAELTDEQWSSVSEAVRYAPATTPGRPREVNLRALLDGILYRHARNCGWRKVPSKYGKRSSLDNYYRQWSQDGTLHRVAVRLRIADLKRSQAELMRLIRYDEKLQKMARRTITDRVPPT